MKRDDNLTNDAQRQEGERAAWDRMADHYDERVMRTYQEAYHLTIEQILAEATPSDQVLEVGCGTGIIALGLSPHVTSVTGVDLSPAMIARAEAKLDAAEAGNLDFRVADAYDLPFKNHAFDLVLVTNLLYLVADPDRVIKEAKRCLKSEGVLISVTDCLLESPPLRLRLMIWLRRLTGLPKMLKYVHYFRKADLRGLYKQIGLTIEKEADMHSQPVNYYLSGKPG